MSEHRWTCTCCGEVMTGLPMDLHFEAPVDFSLLDRKSRKRSHIDTDFCEVNLSDGSTQRYVRALLPLPVPQLEDEFRFGVWVSVSEKSWTVYREGFATGHYSEAGCFGYLMHDIPDFEGSELLQCDVWFQPDGLRPVIELHHVDHPLVEAQQNGVEPRQVERWAALIHQAQ
jgi:hypothetical protein